MSDTKMNCRLQMKEQKKSTFPICVVKKKTGFIYTFSLSIPRGAKPRHPRPVIDEITNRSIEKE